MADGQIIKVAVVDYGMGNIRSVFNAVRELGGESLLVEQPEGLNAADCIIIPGVGAFPEAMRNLNQNGMGEALIEKGRVGVSILGICLGMELLCRDSVEITPTRGLGLLDAHVEPLPATGRLPVPHMGWNALLFGPGDPLMAQVQPNDDVYFVHSFCATGASGDHVVAEVEYGSRFPAILRQGNVVGMQFHPEKSQSTGLQLLANFLLHQADAS